MKCIISQFRLRSFFLYYSIFPTKLLTRFTDCEVIFDLTKLNHVFALIRHTKKIKRIFEKYREHGDKIIKNSIVLKIANPSCPTSIQISKEAR